MRKKILLYLSTGLFIFIIFKSCINIGIASTKNDALLAFMKMDIDKIKSIDSVKTAAKQNLDLLKQSRHEHSDFAQQMFFLLILLFAFQMFLWKFKEK